MRTFLTALLCRFFGRRCSVQRPASRDLRHDMQTVGRRVEAQTVELRRLRRTGDFFDDLLTGSE